VATCQLKSLAPELFNARLLKYLLGRFNIAQEHLPTLHTYLQAPKEANSLHHPRVAQLQATDARHKLRRVVHAEALS
jgi:hypothetical protein